MSSERVCYLPDWRAVNLIRSATQAANVKAELSAERNMRVNMVSLMSSNIVIGVLGLVFWAAAARLFPASEVGVAAALITSAGMLSTLSILSIDSIYERFLPLAGRSAGMLLKHGFVMVAAVAMLAGAALVVLVPKDPLFESDWATFGYPLLVMVLAILTLQDKACAGLGVARWSAAKNSLHAVAKLIILILLAGTASAIGIVLAWGATAAAIAVCVLMVLLHRCRSHQRFQGAPNLPPRQEIWSYFGSSFAITASWASGLLVVPLIVVTQVGAAANAYFAMTWAIINALYLMVHMVVSPYVAEVAANPHKVASLSWRMVRMVIAVSCAGSAVLVVLGPIMLSVAGGDYRAHGQGLLLLAAIFIPLAAVVEIYEAFARVQRRLRLALAVRCLHTIVIVCGSVMGTRLLGVTGVGWAYLAAELISAAVLVIPVVLWLNRVEDKGSGGEINADDRAGDWQRLDGARPTRVIDA
jgi:O-antigen/teichoic acid export membrane protein